MIQSGTTPAKPPNPPKPATTAHTLGAYRRALLAEGIPDELADDLVRDLAMRNLHAAGVRLE